MSSKFPFKHPPSPIQSRGLKKAFKHNAYALYWSMGAGKTFATINLAAARKLREKINHVVVVVNPSAIKDVWEVELEKHCPVDYNCFVFNAGDGTKLLRHCAERDEHALNWVVFGVEAFSQGKAIDSLTEYITQHRDEGIMMVIDEATSIKTPTAARTKKITKQGHRCQYRLILTGTPITQGYQDLFAQMNFLDPDILGCRSYVLFRNLYCIMGGFEGRSIVGYQRVNELMERIAPWCDIVSKEEAMPELEPKQYLPDLVVNPSPEQKSAMEQLKNEQMAEDAGETLTVSMAMERITRYQQICGGFFPYDDTENGGYSVKAISGRNPKLEALIKDVELVHEQGHKTIIWARFIPEIELIRDTLARVFGPESVVDFYGGTPPEKRKEHTRRFQEDPEVRFIVSTQAVGGKGQTWTAATQTRYYSQTFSYEDRMQSEDRNHRRGQTNSVGYRNVVMNVAADRMVAKAISKKHDVSQEFKTGVVGYDLGKAGDLEESS